MPARPILHLVTALSACAVPFATSARAASGEPAEAGRASRSVELVWPQGVNLTMEATDFEIVVRFDRPIDEAMISEFAEANKADLADLRWNDTSLVMRAAAGRRISAVAAGRMLQIQFLPDQGATFATPSAPAQDADTDIDLAITAAQADAAAGYPHKARLRLLELARSRPDDQRIQRALADAEAADGATALAAAHYRSIEADDLAAQRVIAESGGNAVAAITVRDGKTFSQIEGSFAGAVRASQRLLLGGGVRYVRSEAFNVNSAAGLLAYANAHSTIADLTASLRIENSTRLEFKGSAQLDRKIAGAGLQAFFGSPERQARVTLAYRLPDVSTQEQSILGGHISRAGAGGSVRLTPGVFVQGDVAWNGYGLEHNPVRTKTVSATASVEVLLRRRAPTLTVNYRLEAEYTKKTALRPNGLAYIPLDTRENHTVQAVSSIYSSKVQVTAAAGWTVDRYGGADGPTANLSAAASLGRSWRLEGSGGVSSVSRPGSSGRYVFLRFAVTKFLG